jgi:hypothetical protein
VLAIELVLFIVWTILVQIEFYGWSTFAFILNLVSLYLLIKLPILSYFRDHTGTIGILLVLSLCCGLVWAIFMKWPSFLYKFKEVREERLDNYREECKSREAQLRADVEAEDERKLARENAIRAGKGQPPREKVIRNWEKDKNYAEFRFLDHETYKNTKLSKSPRYKEYKGKIVAWVIFWIPSLIGTLLDDFVRRMVTWIVNRFSSLINWMSYRIVGDSQSLPIRRVQMHSRIGWDWKSGPSAEDLQKALKPFGLRVYNDLNCEGSDCFAFIISDTALSKKALYKISEEEL